MSKNQTLAPNCVVPFYSSMDENLGADSKSKVRLNLKGRIFIKLFDAAGIFLSCRFSSVEFQCVFNCLRFLGCTSRLIARFNVIVVPMNLLSSSMLAFFCNLCRCNFFFFKSSFSMFVDDVFCTIHMFTEICLKIYKKCRNDQALLPPSWKNYHFAHLKTRVSDLIELLFFSRKMTYFAVGRLEESLLSIEVTKSLASELTSFH